MQLGPQVDDREAYLDAVLLNVYTGPGVSNVWIDDLEVAGHVASQRGQPSAAQNNSVVAASAAIARRRAVGADPAASDPADGCHGVRPAAHRETRQVVAAGR